MSAKTPLDWAGTGSHSSVAANVATVATPGNWSNCWSQPTAITNGDDEYEFEIKVSRSSLAFFGFTPSGLIPQIQANPTIRHIGLGVPSQTLGFRGDGMAFFGKGVVAQPLARGAIDLTRPYTVTLTVDMDNETIGCTITQSAVVAVRGHMTFAQCGVTKDNAKKMRVLVSWCGAAQGDTLTLHQRIESGRSAARPAREAAAASQVRADADANRQAAASPLLEPSPLHSLLSGTLFGDCKRAVTGAELPVRVAVVGRMGVGKSSVVTLLLSAFQDDHKTRIVRRAEVAALDDHVTTAITEYRLGASGGAAGGVVLVDTWGYTDSNWAEFPQFLLGHLMDGFEKGGSLAPKAAHVRSNVRYADRIHAVIFVVSTLEADVDGKYAQRLKFFTSACSELGIPFLLVATKADQLVGSSGSGSAASPLPSPSSSSSSSGDGGGSELFDTQLLFTDASVVATVERISRQTGVPIGQIFPVKGYTRETVRNRRLETTALRALAEAVEMAVERYDDCEREEAISAQMQRARVAPGGADDDAGAFGRNVQFGSGQRR